jgi:AcrR family transcriptional regulator
VSRQAPNKKGEATRSRVLTAARDLLVQEGYDRFVLREIAARCDMKLGNLQYYFPTRESLIEVLIEREAARDIEAIRAVTCDAADAAEQLRRLTISLNAGWRGESGKVFAVMSLLAQHQQAFAKLYRTVYEAFYAELTPILRTLDSQCAPAVLQTRARLITALWDGAQMQVQCGTPPRAFLNEVAERVVEIASVPHR